MSFIYNFSDNIFKGIPIYNNFKILQLLKSGIKNNINLLKNEINYTFLKGSGIVVVKDIIKPSIINDTNKVIDEITDNQNIPNNDHFSNNLRVWNFYEKFCEKNPELFIEYFKSPIFNFIFQVLFFFSV